MPRRGLWDAHNAASATRLAAMTPEQKAAAREKEKAKLLQLVRCAPVTGDPFAVDWETHDCGYIPKTDRGGKPLPKSGPNAEPAWQWTEEQSPNRRRGELCLRAAVQTRALDLYRIGYRHSKIELLSEGGWPDDTYWGPGGLIIRELKAMRPDWKPGQKQHLLSLREAKGVDVGVWFPCCLLGGRIDAEMAAVAGRQPGERYARGRRAEHITATRLSWQEVAAGML